MASDVGIRSEIGRTPASFRFRSAAQPSVSVIAHFAIRYIASPVQHPAPPRPVPLVCRTPRGEQQMSAHDATKSAPETRHLHTFERARQCRMAPKRKASGAAAKTKAEPADKKAKTAKDAPPTEAEGAEVPKGGVLIEACKS